MKRSNINHSILQLTVVAVLLVSIFYGCANKVPPAGGPYDETPPRLIKSKPSNKALNSKAQKVVLYFDEYVKLEDVANKVIISPPQLKNPKVMAVGKRIIVDLKDDLRDSTTYTIDFTDAIVDNNEGNPLENFSFAFSTGSELDTMEVSGKVLSMRNHEPVQGITVGIHPAEDGWNAFTDTIFQRMSRTSSHAFFVLRNIKQGRYRIYALKESDGNYKHDMPTEGIAFLDSIITTSSMPAVRNDTLWVDSLTVDTIKEVNYTRYTPDNLVLMYYETETPRRYISKRERPDSMQLELTFNLPLAEDLVVTPIDSLYVPIATKEDSTKDSYILDRKGDGVINIYFSDPKWKAYNKFEVRYQSVDSLLQPIVVRDSITLKVKRSEEDSKKSKPNLRDNGMEDLNDSVIPKPKSPFTLKVEHKGDGGIRDSIIFSTSLPIDTTAFKGIELFNANDSILKPVEIDKISLLPGRTTVGVIEAQLSYNTSYELYFDSLAFIDSFGHHLDETAVDAFKTKSKDEFSHLTISVQGVSGPFIGELLNMQDKPIRVLMSEKPNFVFRDLKPDKYAFRLILDRNNNKKWDPGNYKDSIQPEQVYYAPKIFELMQNWDVKESFNPLETPLDKQKPKELIKNKPKEKKKRDLNKEREEEMKRRNQSQRGGLGGFGGAARGAGRMGGFQTATR